MLRRAFNARLDKSLQRTDWTRLLYLQQWSLMPRETRKCLALYSWLKEYYVWALKLHEYTNAVEPVAAWIEPFLQGTSNVSADAALADAKARGIILDDSQVAADCRAALASLTHPMHRSRLLRLIADLSLTELAQDIEPLLQAPAADERAASVRALGRLGVQEAQALIQPLLQDPVQDVRKAAQTALRNLSGKETRAPAPPSKSSMERDAGPLARQAAPMMTTIGKLACAR